MLQGVCVWGSKHLLNFVARYCMKGEHSVVFSSRSDTCYIHVFTKKCYIIAYFVVNRHEKSNEMLHFALYSSLPHSL